MWVDSEHTQVKSNPLGEEPLKFYCELAVGLKGIGCK
jgi:hypothetical protein